MYAHTHTQSHIHISAYHAQQSCTCIEYRIHIYAAHNPHTECTHTETETNKQRYMQHIQENTEQHIEQHTENRTQDTTICSAHNYRTYSFDFYHLQQYIEKLYNTAIYEIYTFWSPY